MTVTLEAEVRAWLAEHWDPDRPLGEWWAILAESGWGFPHFPVEWFGRGLARSDDDGGTDEIQRNIIGERVLGLAFEPRAA